MSVLLSIEVKQSKQNLGALNNNDLLIIIISVGSSSAPYFFFVEVT